MGRLAATGATAWKARAAVAQCYLPRVAARAFWPSALEAAERLRTTRIVVDHLSGAAGLILAAAPSLDLAAGRFVLADLSGRGGTSAAGR